jgi:hypothetical protein
MPTAPPDARLDRVPPALAELVERGEITRLVYRLGVCLDEGRFHDMRDLFVDDAVASTPGGVAEGIDAVVAQAARTIRPATASSISSRTCSSTWGATRRGCGPT